jgi:hypothetical protein
MRVRPEVVLEVVFDVFRNRFDVVELRPAVDLSAGQKAADAEQRYRSERLLQTHFLLKDFFNVCCLPTAR